MWIILVILVLLCYGGGLYHEPFRYPGIGLGTVLLIVLLVLLFRG
jgi:hypothetical protein